MRERWQVARPGEVFLASVRWRPAPRYTGSASPFACLASRLKSFKLEKPFEGPTLGTPNERFLSH